jgi:hypothetical protein
VIPRVRGGPGRSRACSAGWRTVGDRAEANLYAHEPRHPVTEPLGHHTGMGTGELRRREPQPDDRSPNRPRVPASTTGSQVRSWCWRWPAQRSPWDCSPSTSACSATKPLRSSSQPDSWRLLFSQASQASFGWRWGSCAPRRGWCAGLLGGLQHPSVDAGGADRLAVPGGLELLDAPVRGAFVLLVGRPGGRVGRRLLVGGCAQPGAVGAGAGQRPEGVLGVGADAGAAAPR